ncbi:hypothetical protein J6590_076322 [Homalodisca vitripennis]|nr:hypothetical protein J6590_076322 [Homalodisca vitripennis]
MAAHNVLHNVYLKQPAISDWINHLRCGLRHSTLLSELFQMITRPMLSFKITMFSSVGRHPMNKLTGIHFELDCLPRLRFLDLEFNNIQHLDKEDLGVLDKYTHSHNHSLTIDLSNNTLSGDCDTLYSWVQTTKVTVRNKERLHCRARTVSAPQCPLLLAAPAPAPTHTGTELFLFIALCFTLALLAYTNWKPIEAQMKPLTDALSRKVHYTNLGKQEDQEINV